MQTLENIEIFNDSVVVFVIGLSKKMSVYFDGMRRRKGQNTLCHKRPILVLLWVFFDASLHPLFSLIVHFRSNLPNTHN